MRLVRNYSRSSSAIINSVVGFICLVIPIFLQFISRQYFLEYLNVGYLGVQGTYTSFLGTLSLTEVGLHRGIVYYLYLPLKDNNYEVDLEKPDQWREHAAFFFHNKKAFNALVKDALEYYLNNIVLKELGCKITVPKQKSTHGYSYDDVLCYIGDIELETGEQNGSENING